MRKIKYLFLSLLVITSIITLGGCSFFDDVFGPDATEKNKTTANTEIKVCYIMGDKKVYKTYDDYTKVEFETYTTETGYEFSGWSFEENGGIINKNDLIGLNSVTLYPVVNAIKYKIIYDLDGGVNNTSNPSTYTIEDEVTLKAPTKDDYAFDGWYVNDSSELIKEYKIEAGSTGDIRLKANYIHGKINVIFDYPGIDEQIIDYNSKCTKPADPYKIGDTFLYWCSDDSLDTEFDFDTVLTKSITLYPLFENTKKYTLTFNNSSYVKCNYDSGKLLPKGALVTFDIDYIMEGKEFVGYYIYDEILSKCSHIELEMPEFDLEITPMLKDLTTYSYTKGVDLNATIPVSVTNKYLFGSNISNTNYSFSGNNVVLSKTYLDTLSLGLHTFVYNYDTLIYLFVKSSNIEATNIKVDYDINYPKATLYFDEVEGYDYTYSLDGGSYTECHNGITFDIIDKFTSHSIDIKCGTKVTNYQIEAIPNAARTYATTTFTYNGEVYDYYIDSIDDLSVLLEFETQAMYPSVKGTSYKFKFYYPNGSASNVKDVYKYIICRLMSVPYGLEYEYTLSSEVTFTLRSNNTFNSLATSQARKDVTTTEFKASNRSSDFNDFYIEKCSKTQEVRSIYELENLKVGIKPIINDAKTLELYNKAKEILRNYVDDDFTVYEKLKAIYDYIATYVTYDDALLSIRSDLQSNYQSFTSYSALINGVAVCDGYASAFKLLCTMEGIECIEVVGSAKGGGHAWNKVKINNVWYGVDATWSRSTFSGITYVYHSYFLVDETVLMNYAGTNHYEQATKNNDGTYSYFNVDHTANNNLDYFDLNLYGDYDCVCETVMEYIEMFNMFAANSINYVELKLVGLTYEDVAGVITSIYRNYYTVYHTNVDATRIYLIH